MQKRLSLLITVILALGAARPTPAEEARKSADNPKPATLPEAVRGLCGVIKGQVMAKGENTVDIKVSRLLRVPEVSKAKKPAGVVGLTIQVTVRAKAGDAAAQQSYINKLSVGQAIDNFMIVNETGDTFGIMALSQEQRIWAQKPADDAAKPSK